MRKIIPFSRLFVPAAVFSTLLISGGIAAFFVMGGFNLGVDFQSGMVQEVRLAPTAFTLTWDGAGSATLASGGNGMHVVNSGAGMETQSHSFLFGDYPTVGALVAAMTSQLDGLHADLYVSGETSSQWLMLGALGDPVLGSAPHRVHYLDPGAAEVPISTIRDIMEESLGQAVVVQNMGQPSERHFLIRVQTEGGRPGNVLTGTSENELPAEFSFDMGENVEPGEIPPIEPEEWLRSATPVTGSRSEGIAGILEAHFGEGQVVVLRSVFVGSRFAGNLTDQIGLLIAATLLLVLFYASIRFRLQYAVGAVLGIIHDGIVVVAFVVVTRMEFNTITIAAILTILGYSTNNTIVVFDRIRENRRLYPEESFINILNRSLTETLNRTIITTVTTMLAVMSLFVFTSGTMRDFALALMIGMTSGVYTTTFIVTAFMNFWEKRKVKKAKRATAALASR